MDVSHLPQGAMPSETWVERKARIRTTIADNDNPHLTAKREEVEMALFQNGHPQLEAVVRPYRIQSLGWAPICTKVTQLTRGSKIAPDGIHISVPSLIAWCSHLNKPPHEIMGWAPELAAVAS